MNKIVTKLHQTIEMIKKTVTSENANYFAQRK